MRSSDLIEDEVGFFERQRVGIGIAPLLQYLVAYAPDSHTWMVAVTANKICEVALMPLVEETCIVACCLFLTPHVESLIHDDETHLVTQVKQFRCRWVVAAPDAIESCSLQYLQLAFYGTTVDGSTKATEVMMVADTLYLYMLAIDEASL